MIDVFNLAERKHLFGKRDRYGQSWVKELNAWVLVKVDVVWKTGLIRRTTAWRLLGAYLKHWTDGWLGHGIQNKWLETLTKTGLEAIG